MKSMFVIGEAGPERRRHFLHPLHNGFVAQLSHGRCVDAGRSRRSGSTGPDPQPPDVRTGWKCPTPPRHSGGAATPRSGRRVRRRRTAETSRSASTGGAGYPGAADAPAPRRGGRCPRWSPQSSTRYGGTAPPPSGRRQGAASLTSPHDRIASRRLKTRQSIPTQVATGPAHTVAREVWSSSRTECKSKPFYMRTVVFEKLAPQCA